MDKLGLQLLFVTPLPFRKGGFYEGIDDCARHRIPIMVMHVTKGHNPPPTHKAAVNDFSAIVSAAEQANVRIAIENTRREDVLTLLFAEFPSLALGLCYDSSHNWLYGAKKTGILQRHGDRLFATHLSDNDGHADRHWLPGHGIINWPLIASAFPRDHYQGTLFFEVFPMESEQQMSAYEFVNQAFHIAKKMRRSLPLTQ